MRFPCHFSSKASLIEIIADNYHLCCVLLWLFSGINHKSFTEYSFPPQSDLTDFLSVLNKNTYTY